MELKLAGDWSSGEITGPSLKDGYLSSLTYHCHVGTWASVARALTFKSNDKSRLYKKYPGFYMVASHSN
jgi:hypothetical protein